MFSRESFGTWLTMYLDVKCEMYEMKCVKCDGEQLYIRRKARGN